MTLTEKDLDIIDGHIDSKIKAIEKGSRNRMCYVKIEVLIELVKLSRERLNEMGEASKNRS